MSDVYPLWTVALTVLSAVDVMQTEEALDNGMREANPVVAWLMEKLGDRWWYPKILLVVVGGLVVEGRGYVTAMKLACLVQALVIAWNGWKMKGGR